VFFFDILLCVYGFLRCTVLVDKLPLYLVRGSVSAGRNEHRYSLLSLSLLLAGGVRVASGIELFMSR
jgi:hypothetical protein